MVNGIKQYHSPPPAPFYPAFKFKYSILAQWEQDSYSILSVQYFISLALNVFSMFFTQTNTKSLY